MALLAEQFEVLPVQRDAWVVDVLRGEVNLVVNDLARATAPLAKAVLRLEVGVAAALPGCGLVEPAGPGLHSCPVLPLRRPPSALTLWRPADHALALIFPVG